jgi:hypothetical protein
MEQAAYSRKYFGPTLVARLLEEAANRITVLEAERDAWRRLFGLQTSGGWQTPDEAAKLHHETYQHGGKLLREAKARAERAEGRLQAIDNGNTFVFCDFVDERHRGCIRGAGHNGSHAVCLPPYPLGPVLLVDEATSNPAIVKPVDEHQGIGSATDPSVLRSSVREGVAHRPVPTRNHRI